MVKFTLTELQTVREFVMNVSIVPARLFRENRYSKGHL